MRIRHILQEKGTEVVSINADRTIHNAIGKKPEKRYQSGKKMAAHLKVCLERVAGKSDDGEEEGNVGVTAG